MGHLVPCSLARIACLRAGSLGQCGGSHQGAGTKCARPHHVPCVRVLMNSHEYGITLFSICRFEHQRVQGSLLGVADLFHYPLARCDQAFVVQQANSNCTMIQMHKT